MNKKYAHFFRHLYRMILIFHLLTFQRKPRSREEKSQMKTLLKEFVEVIFLGLFVLRK